MIECLKELNEPLKGVISNQLVNAAPEMKSRLEAILMRETREESAIRLSGGFIHDDLKPYVPYFLYYLQNREERRSPCNSGVFLRVRPDEAGDQYLLDRPEALKPPRIPAFLEPSNPQNILGEHSHKKMEPGWAQEIVLGVMAHTLVHHLEPHQVYVEAYRGKLGLLDGLRVAVAWAIHPSI